MSSLIFASIAFASVGIASNLIGFTRLKSKEEMGIVCKIITETKCPYCSHERCHDKEHQWDEQISTCPAVNCVEEHTEKFDPKEWGKP